MSKLPQQLTDNLSEMLTSNAHVLLAVSGGLDSMTMLHALANIQKEQPNLLANLHIAHLNHQLRGTESQMDAQLVQNQAKALGLNCTVESIDVGRIAAETSESIELTARKERYRFLAKTAKQNNCPNIALAHNADDNVETILHRIIRGTGIQGLAGIPPKRPLTQNETGLSDDFSFQIIRPLLATTRQQIQQYATEHNIPYRTDQSNFDEQFTRNRIRHELIPLLKEHYNPNVHTAITQLGTLSAMLAPAISDDAKQQLTAITKAQTKATLTLCPHKLSALTTIQQTQVIREALNKLGIPQQRIGYKNITAVTTMLTSDSPQTITLPYNIKVATTQGDLTISLPTEPNSNSPIPTQLTIPSLTKLTHYQLPNCPPDTPLTIETSTLPGGQSQEKLFRQTKTPFQEMIDLDCVNLPLTLRSRQSGDTFQPLGAPGEKKIGDILTDQKIPTAIRDSLPMICDSRGVIWIAGIRIAQRVKITESTRNILKLIIQADGQ